MNYQSFEINISRDSRFDAVEEICSSFLFAARIFTANLRISVKYVLVI